MSKPLRLLTCFAIVPAALLFAGCDKTIDTGSLQDKISELIAQQPQGAKPKSVKCPDDITAKKGKTFDCTVTYANGSTQKATVTLADDNGKFSVTLGAQSKATTGAPTSTTGQ